MQDILFSAASHDSCNLSEFPRLVTVPEAAKILRVDESSVRRYLAKGKIQGVKIGGLWRIKPDDLRALINGLSEAA